MEKNQIIFLIKYIDPKYLWSFLEGDVHFASLNYFRKEEIGNLDDILGDGAEGDVINLGDAPEVIKLGQNLKYISSKQAKKLLDNITPEQKISFEIGISPKERDEVGIASFFAITDNDVIKDPHHNRINEKDLYCIKNNVIADMNNFNKGYGRIPVVIPFQEILLGWLKYQNLEYNKIIYYDEQKYQPDIVNEVKENPIRAVFYKRKKYSAQREFRIITKINNTKTGDTIRIPMIKLLDKWYGNDILPRLVFNWNVHPRVHTRLPQCDKVLRFGK